jgi:hypothetical protein
VQEVPNWRNNISLNEGTSHSFRRGSASAVATVPNWRQHIKTVGYKSIIKTIHNIGKNAIDYKSDTDVEIIGGSAFCSPPPVEIIGGNAFCSPPPVVKKDNKKHPINRNIDYKSATDVEIIGGNGFCSPPPVVKKDNKKHPINRIY